MTENSSQSRIAFLDMLRASAALMVFYSHIVMWMSARGSNPYLYRLLNDYFARPLGLTGFHGVALFFLISGYIITHVSQREGGAEFALKRILRIYPPIIVSILLTALVHLWVNGAVESFYRYAASASLTAYFLNPPVESVNGVLWTLVVEMMFYTLVLACMPLMRRGWYATVSIIILVASLLVVKHLGFMYAFFASYLPYLVMGQLIYFLSSKRISRRWFFALTAVAYIVSVKLIKKAHPDHYVGAEPYALAFTYVYLIFVLFLILEPHIRIARFFRYTADVSYSMYLNHGIVAGPLLGYLYVLMPGMESLALVLTVAAVYLISALSFKFVEDPSRRVARALVKRFSLGVTS